MITIKVLGSGCPNCVQVETAAKSAVDQLGIKAEITKVTGWQEIQAYHILATPGLVINEKVVSAGRIPAQAEIMSWIADAFETA